MNCKPDLKVFFDINEYGKLVDIYFSINIHFVLYTTFKMIRTNWYDKGESIIARELQGDLLMKNVSSIMPIIPLVFIRCVLFDDQIITY